MPLSAAPASASPGTAVLGDPALAAIAAPGWLASLRRGGWTAAAAPLASLAILPAALYQLRWFPIGEIAGLLPTSPGFWIAFALCYVAGPVAEWCIYRRLWGLPPGGLAPLLRKTVSNEVLLGYSGEAYFYAWVRRHRPITAAPFGAIKDVAILSGAAGNAAALVMVLAAWPLVDRLDLGLGHHAWLGSLAIMAGALATVMVLRRRLLALPAADLRHILAMHVARIVATTVLTGLMWHLMLPGVALGTWLVLATVRQLVSRLPLVPSKEVVFAGAVTLISGPGTGVAAATAAVASLVLLTHLAVGIVLGTVGAAREVAR